MVTRDCICEIRQTERGWLGDERSKKRKDESESEDIRYVSEQTC